MSGSQWFLIHIIFGDVTMRIIYILVTLALVGYAVYSSGGKYYPVYLNWPSFIIVGVPTALAFFVGYTRSPKAALWSACHAAWISGLLGTLIGAIIILLSIATHFNNNTDWAASVAVSLITLFYGITLSLILCPLAIAASDEKPSTSIKDSGV